MTASFDFQSFPLLETERLTLREITDADAPALFEYYRDPELTRFVSFNRHASVDDTLKFIAWIKDIYQQKDSIRWGIQHRERDQLIGTCGLHFWKRDLCCAEVGYHVGRPFWGHGIATEALRAMVDFGFHHMNLNRIEGRHNAGNDASGAVMQKVGFQREGIWRQREIKHGEFVDVVQFSLLRGEYLPQ